MTPDTLDRGTVLTCTQCNAETTITHKDELPAGWIILRNQDWMQISCPTCDAKEQARIAILMRREKESRS